MKTQDYSREIFEKYYSSDRKKILIITLKDDTILEGTFIGFFHGDENSNEPYITKWHFLDKNDINNQSHLISIDGSEDYGQIIKQEDIKSVTFKT